MRLPYILRPLANGLLATGVLINLLRAQESPPADHSVTAALARFELHPDLIIEPVATEPQVRDPVAMQFDEWGRLWLVEMGDYPGPMRGEIPDQQSGHDAPNSRIRLLEDLDGDGFMETAHTFADQLTLATGVQPWRDGVIVTVAGEILFLRDQDGDHHVDTRETWFRGFAQENPQLRANDPTYMLDGWVAIATGLRGGSVEAVHPLFRQTMGEDRIRLSKQGFRFHPQSGAAEATTGESQFGIAVDAWGNRFVCDNRHPLRHVMLEHKNLSALSALKWTQSIHDVMPAGEESRTFPIGRQETTSYLHGGQFTAACGIHFYHGGNLPRGFRHSGFVCEPTASLVQRAVLNRSGVTFSATRGRPQEEFLASTDNWFRPVFVTDGPDGALYVVDMCRAVVEHPDWMPDLAKRTDLRDGAEFGRIWRVRHRANPKPSPQIVPGRLNVDGLFAELGNDNLWRRRTAARLLRQAAPPNLPQRLQQAYEESPNPLSRAAAVEMLSSLEPELLRAEWLSAEPHPEVQRLLIAHCFDGANSLDVQHTQQLVRLANDEKTTAPVQFQALLALARSDSPHAIEPLITNVLRWSRLSEWQQVAWLAAIRPLADQTLHQTIAALLAQPDPWTSQQRQFVRRLSRLVTAQNPKQLGKSIEQFIAASQDVKQRADTVPLSHTLLRGIAEGLGGDERVLEAWFQNQSATLLDWWTKTLEEETRIATDAAQSVARRTAGLELLRHATAPQVRDALLRLALSDASLEIRSQAIEALGGDLAPEQVARLLDSLAVQSLRIRTEIVDSLLGKQELTQRLLDHLESDGALVHTLSPSQVARLLDYPHYPTRQRSQVLLAEITNEDRSGIIESYQTVEDLTGDPATGLQVFTKHCAACHRVGSTGHIVGPDVADNYNKSAAQLLEAILDPNKAIDANYVSFTVVSTSGTTLTGILTAETKDALTLRLEQGRSVTLEKDHIDEILPSRSSLMPNGFEKEISPQQMADLIAFLKKWRELE